MHSGSPSVPTGQRRLAQGQSAFEKLSRGTVIRVAAGSVVLVQRITLDHGGLAYRSTLQRGAVHCVPVTDWLEIVAQSDAELVLLVPPPVSPQPMWNTLGTYLLRGWRALKGTRALWAYRPQ
jgi:hypothetical protein